jgi:formylmethanofuran dehydrogenase subunit E
MNVMKQWLRGLAGFDGGVRCRRCSESISDSDEFGQSEGVCRPCRDDSG